VSSQAEIQYECAFTYMNAVFRRNLTDALAVDANDVDTASDTGGALAEVRDRARFGRTTATCIWGVSDPRQLKHGAVIGGWQRGLTPQMSPPLLLTAASTATRAGKSAALSTRAKLLIVRNIAKCDMPSRSRGPRVGLTNTRYTQGDHSSRVCGPPALSSLSSIPAASREGRARFKRAQSRSP
jgi:hypothetical protein